MSDLKAMFAAAKAQRGTTASVGIGVLTSVHVFLLCEGT